MEKKKVSDLVKAKILERCPRCDALGQIDEEQKQGKVSIICSECGHHYHKKTLETITKEDVGSLTDLLGKL